MSNKWPYLAGILDGEGTICLYNGKQKDGYHHSSLQVIIYGTSMKLMRWLVSNAGGKFYVRTKQTGVVKSKREQYAWHPSGRKNRENFLLGVLPYLVIKQEQAKLALEFLRLGDQVKSPDERNKLVEQCRLLNRGEEPLETNTQDVDSDVLKIESELTGDCESVPKVT